jgi:hypothetical protein
MKRLVVAVLGVGVLGLWGCGGGGISGGGGSDGNGHGGDGRTSVIDAWVPPPLVDGGPLSDGPVFTNPCSPNPLTSVTGVVYAPNGVDPISGATIYTTASTPAPLSSLACEACAQQPMGSETFTHSDVNGNFTIVIPADAQYLVIQLGHFRRIEPVSSFAMCQANALTPAQSRLPKNASEGDIPKIAVTTGSSDRTENVLLKLGLDPGSFDLYQGMTNATPGATCAIAGLSSCTMDKLLTSPSTMALYNIIVIDCRDNYEQMLLGSGAIAQTTGNLLQFVQGGGRLYVDDESYEFEEATFPEAIAWEPNPTPGSSTPEINETAKEGSSPIGEVGVGGTGSYPGTVTDPDMLKWLVARGAVPATGAVTLTQFLGEWGVMNSIASSGTDWTNGKTYVTGSVAWKSGGAQQTGVRPLTVSFDYHNLEGTQCGRVLYTSYHTDSSTSSTSSTWTAQERILEYNLLNIGTCIKIIG